MGKCVPSALRSSGGSKGIAPTSPHPPPHHKDQNFLNFMQFFAQCDTNYMLFHTFVDIMNWVGVRQNTVWLVPNSPFSSTVIFFQKRWTLLLQMEPTRQFIW